MIESIDKKRENALRDSKVDECKKRSKFKGGNFIASTILYLLSSIVPGEILKVTVGVEWKFQTLELRLS